MAIPNPLTPVLKQAEAGFIPYGPGGPEEGRSAVQIVDSFGRYEAEYAAIRKGVGLMDLPQRGVVAVGGSDRLDFLHRLLTHDTRSLQPGQGRRAFLLNKAGRIAADLIVLHGQEHTYLELEVFQARGLIAELEKYRFTEDITFRDASDQYHCLALHGPGSAAFLGGVGCEPVGGVAGLSHRWVKVADQRCLLFRRDETGGLGLHLLVPSQGVVALYQRLVDALAGGDGAQAQRASGVRGRPIGWLAYNTARIEAGVPIYHIDFGPDTLPHETGVLHDAVSFTKGCYIGQEIVARMENLGHPKRVLVGLRFEEPRLPIAGTQVFEPPSTGRDPALSGCADGSGSPHGAVVGAVTSSTVSPMMGGVAVAFAMIKWGQHQPGTNVLVPAEGHAVPATVRALASIKP